MLDSEPWLSDHFGVLTSFDVNAFEPETSYASVAAARRGRRTPVGAPPQQTQQAEMPWPDAAWGI